MATSHGSGGGGKKEDERNLRGAARKAFVSAFLGGRGGWDPSDRGGKVHGGGDGNGEDDNDDPSGRSRSTGSPHNLDSSASAPTVGGLQRQVAEQIDKLIPKDRESLRETALFREAYKGIQWQRDNYVVGREYANWQRKERSRRLYGDDADGGGGRRRHRTAPQSYAAADEIPYDETALAHAQLARLAAPFLVSGTVRTALLGPVVVPAIGGPLYPVARHGLVSLIESQRDNLHSVLKDQILQFLNDPENRASIKNSTKGLMSTTAYRE
jgi:hypothetical protein